MSFVFKFRYLFFIVLLSCSCLFFSACDSFTKKNSKLSVPYKALVMYDGYELHRVTNLESGQKKSIVMWLQNKEQNK